MSKKDDALMLAMQQFQKLGTAFMPHAYWNRTEIFAETNKVYMICKEALTTEETNELHTRSGR
jgi:Tfp pilus assembly protein PilZ